MASAASLRIVQDDTNTLHAIADKLTATKKHATKKHADKKMSLEDLTFGKMYESSITSSISNIEGTLTPRDNRVIQATFVSAYNQVKPLGDKMAVDGVSIQSETVEDGDDGAGFTVDAPKASASGSLSFPYGRELYLTATMDYVCEYCFSAYNDDDDWYLGADASAQADGKKTNKKTDKKTDKKAEKAESELLNKSPPPMDDDVLSMLEDAWCLMMQNSGSPRLANVSDCKVTFN